MKKTLLALSVSAALPVMAHAQTNVTMYGVADAGVGYVKTDSLLANGARSSGTVNLISGVQSTSRIGFRGTEDLGGGLAAIFNAEAGWSVDDGTGASTGVNTGGGINFARRSFVGLRGGFGEVYLGRDYSPAFYTAAANDIGGWGLLGTIGGFADAGYQSIRFSNAVFYNTPTFGGLQIRMAAGNGAAANTEYDTSPKGRDRNFEIAALYAAGPWTANGYFRYGNQDGAAGSSLLKVKQYGVGGGYNFGLVRVVAGYMGSDPGHDPITATTVVGPGVGRVNAYNLGVGVRVAAGELMAQAWQARFSDEFAEGKPKATFASLAYTYPLSKRTNLYASYAWGHNQNGANIALAASGPTFNSTGGTATDSKPQAVVVGMRHQF